jgi:phage terminase large subunit-like protein
VARYAGTRLGRQELDGEMIEDRTDALFTRAMIEAQRCETAPPLRQIVVAVERNKSPSLRSAISGSALRRPARTIHQAATAQQRG